MDDDLTRLPEGSKSSDSQVLKVGQEFGQYTVTKLVGRGGMGEVYVSSVVATERKSRYSFAIASL
jgi:hypothetical protein